MADHRRKALIIIPTYNERENIQLVVPLLAEVFKRVPNWQMGALVVDDSSPDGTADQVKALAKKYTWLELLVNKNKAGLGAAYLKGMDFAFHTLDADVVFEFDADLSHDPQKIPDFLAAIEDGADLVLGSRYIKGGSIPDNWGLHRKFLSVIGNLVIMCAFTDFHIRDWTGGYRALTKKVYESVSPYMRGERFSGYTFQIGFLTKAVRKGFKIVEIPFHFSDREIGESKLGTDYLINILLFIFKLRTRDVLENRIFKFVMVGGIGALVQFVSLAILRRFLPYQLAFFLAIEVSVVSNFTLSNLWTFADRKLKLTEVPSKLIQFNFASGGSIFIQQVIAFLGQTFIGVDHLLFRVPFTGLAIDSGMSFAVIGILIGMFWNFFAYNAFIWKKKS